MELKALSELEEIDWEIDVNECRKCCDLRHCIPGKRKVLGYDAYINAKDGKEVAKMCICGNAPKQVEGFELICENGHVISTGPRNSQGQMIEKWNELVALYDGVKKDKVILFHDKKKLCRHLINLKTAACPDVFSGFASWVKEEKK